MYIENTCGVYIFIYIKFPRYIFICSSHLHSFIPIFTLHLTKEWGVLYQKSHWEKWTVAIVIHAVQSLWLGSSLRLKLCETRPLVFSYPVVIAYCVLSENLMLKLLRRGDFYQYLWLSDNFNENNCDFIPVKLKGSQICMHFSSTVPDLRRHTHVLLVVFSGSFSSQF